MWFWGMHTRPGYTPSFRATHRASGEEYRVREGDDFETVRIQRKLDPPTQVRVREPEPWHTITADEFAQAFELVS